MAKGWRHPGRRAVEAEAGQGFDAARRMVPHVWPNPGQQRQAIAIAQY